MNGQTITGTPASEMPTLEEAIRRIVREELAAIRAEEQRPEVISPANTLQELQGDAINGVPNENSQLVAAGSGIAAALGAYLREGRITRGDYPNVLDTHPEHE